MLLSQLCQGTGWAAEEGADREIRGLSADSRRIEKDWLFIAVKGVAQDGSAFIDAAVENGAVVVAATGERPEGLPTKVAWLKVDDDRRAQAELAANFWGRPSDDLELVGVTGTNGKTTTTTLVESILKKARGGCGLISTVRLSAGKNEVPGTMTTPAPEDLQRALAGVRATGWNCAAMEVSSHALHQGRVAGLKFKVGATTSFGRDHLEYHGSLEAYAESKARFIEMLPPGSTLVLNIDDEVFRGFASRRQKGVSVLSFSPAGQAEADLRAEVVGSGFGGSRLVLRFRGQEQLAQCSLFGEPNVENMLAAAGAALAMGQSLEEVAAGFEAFRDVPGRLEKIELAAGFDAYVDYLHTPDAYRRVLQALRAELRKRGGKLLLVFGCGGERDRGKRPEIGRWASAGADLVFLTADNPRGEKLDDIAAQIEAGRDVAAKKEQATWCRIDDRKEAIETALEAADTGDLVLVAGKGHERTQSFADETIYWDDRQVVLDWFEKRKA